MGSLGPSWQRPRDKQPAARHSLHLTLSRLRRLILCAARPAATTQNEYNDLRKLVTKGEYVVGS